MQVQPIKFVASGIVGTAGATDTVDSPLSGEAFAPFDSTSTIVVAQEAQQVVGIAYSGFTAIVIHNGADTSGDVVAVCGGAGTYSWNYEVNCQKGIYLECTGTGKGTIWLV